MLIFIGILIVANMLVTGLFTFIYANTAAIYSLLALLIFATLAMTFIQSTRRFAWVGFVMVILLYVAVDVLQPYTVSIAWIISAILAIVATVVVKRPMLRMVRRNRNNLPAWSRIVLSIIELKLMDYRYRKE